MINDSVGIFNSVQRQAKAIGLTLVQEKGCKQPRTDLASGFVYVEPLDAYWSIERINKWRGEVYHEIGHQAPEVSDMLPFMRKKGLSFDSFFGKLMNCAEDYRNEFNNYEYWPGRDEALSWTQGFYCTQGAMSLASHSEHPMDADMKVFTNVLSWLYTVRGKYQIDVAAPAMDFAMYAEDCYSHLTTELEAMITAEDVYNLVRKILDDSPEHDTDEEEQKSKDAATKSEESDSEGDEEGDGDGEGSEDGEGEEGEGRVKKVSYEDLMGHSHSDRSDSEGYTEIEYDHEVGSYKPWTKMLVMKARDLPHRAPSTSMKDYYDSGVSLAGTARRLFQSRTQSMNTHNHKTGRLDKRDLYRVPNGHTDVFTRKSPAPDPKGTALLLLTDGSASMNGRKFNVTSAAVALLNDAVQPLGIPTKIVAFTENSRSGCEHYIVKDFNERRKSADILQDYGNIARKTHQNADGESLMWAFKELSSRPEPRKILLVLSDGNPCCDNWGDCHTYTQDVVKHISKYVECYGIGILSDAVEAYYPEYVVLRDVKHLEQAMLDVIKTKIFTGV
jgi:cobalamin biosynthesis protein CobT